MYFCITKNKDLREFLRNLRRLHAKAGHFPELYGCPS
jgi:hypothetical protein